MALFEEQTTRSGDAATRALSVTTVGTDFVERVYQNIAQIYDYTYGPTLHPGRLEAIKKMRIRPGTEVLEVGVGTGINLSLYPNTSQVTGIDLSSKMLKKAQQRIDEKGLTNCEVKEMDATKMTFADNSYDVVYAPYVISVVPDPVAVAREMYRVCRPGGRVVILNHFKSANALMGEDRNRDLAGHRAHRLHRGPRSAGVPEAGRPDAGVDRKGEHPEDLDAHHGRQRLAVVERRPSSSGPLNAQLILAQDHEQPRPLGDDQSRGVF